MPRRKQDRNKTKSKKKGKSLSKSLLELRYRPANDNILAPNSLVQANVIDDNSIDPVNDNNDVNDFVNQEEPWPNNGRFNAQNVISSDNDTDNVALNRPVQANVIDDNASIDPVDDNYDVTDYVNQEKPWPNSGRFNLQNVTSSHNMNTSTPDLPSSSTSPTNLPNHSMSIPSTSRGISESAGSLSGVQSVSGWCPNCRKMFFEMSHEMSLASSDAVSNAI